MCDLVSSSTRRIPHRSYNRSARRGPTRCSSPSSRSCPRRRAEQPGLFLSVSPDSGEGSRMSWVGLEDTAARYSGQRQRHPRRRWRVRRASRPGAARPHRFRTGSGSGSRSTRALTTTWCESPSTVRTSVSASRRGRTTTAPLRSRHHRRTAIRPRPSTACSSAPACQGPRCARRWWLPVRQREHHSEQRPWSARLRRADRQESRREHGDDRRPHWLPDHRPQPRPSQPPATSGLRSHPAPMTFVSATEAASHRPPRCLGIPRLRPGQRVTSTSCSRSMPTRRRAG